MLENETAFSKENQEGRSIWEPRIIAQDISTPERGQTQARGVDFSHSRTEGDVYNSGYSLGRGLVDPEGYLSAQTREERAGFPETSLGTLQQLL